jgi:hypothetical protein
MSIPLGVRDRGRLTPPTFDLLRRSAMKMKVAAALASLAGLAALAGGLFLLGALGGKGLPPGMPQQGLAAASLGVAVACLAGVWPLWRFGVMCGEPVGAEPEATEWKLEEACRSLRDVWIRTAVAVLIAVCAAGVLAVLGEPAPPPPPAAVDRTGHLRAVEPGAPQWTPPSKEVSAPGRVLGFADVPAACAVSWNSSLCLLNVGGEEVAGGSRRVLRKDVRIAPPGFTPAEHANQVTLQAGLSGAWSLTIAPPPGADWEAGADYDTFSRLPLGYDTSLPYFRLNTSDLLCSDSSYGRFRVVSVQRRPDDGSLSSMVVDFEAPCGEEKIVGRFAAAR